MNFVATRFNNVTILLYNKGIGRAFDRKVLKIFSKSVAINITNDKYGTINFDFKHSEIRL